jgi:hypothetical protein
MFRSISLFPAAVAMSLVGVGSAGVSNASPSEEGGSGSCSFVLTPPEVVQVSDTRMVLATVKPGPCTMDALPNESVVCLAIEGSQGQCGNKSGSLPAVVLVPYRPGATYVASGQGCADLFENPANHSTTGPVIKICRSVGPSSFTL